MASGKDTRTKVVLARILEKQGLGGTPVLRLNWDDCGGLGYSKSFICNLFHNDPAVIISFSVGAGEVLIDKLARRIAN